MTYKKPTPFHVHEATTICLDIAPTLILRRSERWWGGVAYSCTRELGEEVSLAHKAATAREGAFSLKAVNLLGIEWAVGGWVENYFQPLLTKFGNFLPFYNHPPAPSLRYSPPPTCGIPPFPCGTPPPFFYVLLFCPSAIGLFFARSRRTLRP